MRIPALKCIYSTAVFKKNNLISLPLGYSSNQLPGLGSDIVSFSGKDYGKDSISDLTYHCAYCGEKVYNEQQIDGIAKEILQQKADRLSGKLKSVLEKLSGAKNSHDLKFMKGIENKEQIDFFQNLLSVSSKKSYLRGEEIMKEVYDLDLDQAVDLLKENMHPLLSTIDHVTPQKADKDNDNVDSNLVEACYCCNHDIKRGIEFTEFYTMFPEIEFNMPKEKFIYAKSQILDVEDSGIEQRLSATSLMKNLDMLFAGKKETQNQLNTINSRIKDCDAAITFKIETYSDEIKQKEQEISESEQRLEIRKQDPEFNAMLKRLELNDSLKTEDGIIKDFRKRRQYFSNLVSDLQGVKKNKRSKNKKNKVETPKVLSEDEKIKEEEIKNKKIENLRKNIESLNIQIGKHLKRKENIESELEALDRDFPTVNDYIHKKRQADSVINAYLALENAENDLKSVESDYEESLEKEKDLTDEVEAFPVKEFDPDSYPTEELDFFKQYLTMLQALELLEQSKNVNPVRLVINSSAKSKIEEDINNLPHLKIFDDYNSVSDYKLKCDELSGLKKRTKNLKNKINELNKTIRNNRHLTEKMSLEEARRISDSCALTLTSIKEKENDLDIPRRIESLRASIDLISSTIENLRQKQIDIYKN